MTKLRNWALGAVLLVLFPILIPLGAFWVLFWAIPYGLGKVIFDWLDEQ